MTMNPGKEERRDAKQKRKKAEDFEGEINKLNLNNLPGKQVGVPFPTRGGGQQCVINGVEEEIRKSEECIVKLNTQVLQWPPKKQKKESTSIKQINDTQLQ